MNQSEGMVIKSNMKISYKAISLMDKMLEKDQMLRIPLSEANNDEWLNTKEEETKIDSLEVIERMKVLQATWELSA